MSDTEKTEETSTATDRGHTSSPSFCEGPRPESAQIVSAAAFSTTKRQYVRPRKRLLETKRRAEGWSVALMPQQTRKRRAAVR